MKRIGLLTFFSFVMVFVSSFILAPLLAVGKYDPSGKIAEDLNFGTFNLLPVMFFGLMFICIGLLMLLPNKFTLKAIITYVFGFPIILIGAGIFLLGAYFCLKYQPYIILGFALTILYLLIPKGKFKYASEVKLTENSLDIINNKNQRISYSIPAISRVFLIGNFDGFVIETKSSRETYETKMKFSQLAQLFEPLKDRLFTLTAKLIGSARGKSIREIFGKEVNENNFKIKTEAIRYRQGRHTTRDYAYIPKTDQWLDVEEAYVWNYDYKNNNIIAKRRLDLFGIRFWSITLGYLILMYVGEKLIPLKQIN
ncbi:MAG: hypothetical protein AABX07_01860 [Nanoarchaeota archaeon]